MAAEVGDSGSGNVEHGVASATLELEESMVGVLIRDGAHEIFLVMTNEAGVRHSIHWPDCCHPYRNRQSRDLLRGVICLWLLSRQQRRNNK